MYYIRIRILIIIEEKNIDPKKKFWGEKHLLFWFTVLQLRF